MIARSDLRDVHPPHVGGRRLEHLARGGSHFAHGLQEVAKAPRAVCILPTIRGFVAEGLGDPHAGPVGLELVRDGHRERRADALAHLGPVRDDGDEPRVVD